MSRVKGVADRTIKVHIHDVRPLDVLASTLTERDPIVIDIERNGEKVKYHFLPRPHDHMPDESSWFHPRKKKYIFVHDLFLERMEFDVKKKA